MGYLMADYGVPTKFNPKRGKYEPIHAKRNPPNASRNYPKWICKSSCRESVAAGDIDENYTGGKCPYCRAPLIRYLKYEQKG